MKICILGCGPTGLLAAHAVVQAGHHPVIISQRRKSEMFGAMYLHRSIPGITPDEPEHEITIIKTGTKEGYAKNVYGDPNHPVSWDKFEEGLAYGWSLKRAYDKLWDLYEGYIFDMKIGPAELHVLEGNYPHIYSSIPAQILCHGPHKFESQAITIHHGPANPPLIPDVNDNDIMYYNGYPPDGSVDGVEGFQWYRFSQIDQYQAWEYGCFLGQAPVDPDDTRYEWSEGRKPLSTNCDCHPTIRRIGRFGKWEKQVLTHHAYEQVQDEMEFLNAL